MSAKTQKATERKAATKKRSATMRERWLKDAPQRRAEKAKQWNEEK